MKERNTEASSIYNQYLPATLQKDIFLGKFLLAFEKILRGNDNSAPIILTGEQQKPPGLEEIIDIIYLYFNSQHTPKEFLPWLAGWIALSLREDWSIDVQRAFIQQMVGIYHMRGTKAGLIKILELYLEVSGLKSEEKIKVFDQFDNLPYYFQVILTIKDHNYEKYWQLWKIAKAIIDREKAADTFYALKILVPTMRIPSKSKILEEKEPLIICKQKSPGVYTGNTVIGTTVGGHK